ncbi:MAG: mannonate dehydratase [Ostreibacterium sp.]
MSETDLRDNLQYFLQRTVPIVEQADVKMAIHPDDPPWSIFGLPRIVKNKEDLQAIIKIMDIKYNVITFCTGSLGACLENNLVEMITYFGSMKRIHFAHTRNVQAINSKNFREVAHSYEIKVQSISQKSCRHINASNSMAP